jgi:hypothetical protein
MIYQQCQIDLRTYQVAIGVFDDGVLDDAVVVGWKLDLLGSLLHYGFILLLYEIIRAHDNSDKNRKDDM